MGVTVNVNMRSVVHKDSSGIASAFPDVCKTPAPPSPSPIPIPYPNISKSADTSKGSTSVKMDGNPIMLKDSEFMMSTGDEAGSAGGNVVTNKIKGPAKFLMYSFDVKVEGKNVPRQLDIMMHNIAASSGTPPFPCMQPGGGMPPITKESDEKGEIVEVEWDE
ncbi:MAG: DUF4150 domain-containing protein [Deltaproteobacteria bacterium]|nr:MAG: DUF4150 domain-containing protein [Deltaproteobacteria bacterium]